MFLKILLVASALVTTVNSLQCVFGGQNVMNKKIGTSPDINVTCRSHTKFCLKLESDAVVNGERVKGFARGCDQEMPGSAKYEFCKTEGCISQRDGRGSARVCCCSNDYCNGEKERNSKFTLYFTNLFFLTFFLNL